MSLAGASILWKHDLDAAVEAGSKSAQDVKAKNGHAPGWKQELEELAPRFAGLPSTEQAEARLASLQSAIASQEKELAGQIEECREALDTPHLSPLEQDQVRQRIAKVEEQLSDFKRNARVPLAQAKAAVESCREWNPKRGRYEELRAREAAIKKAVGAVVRT